MTKVKVEMPEATTAPEEKKDNLIPYDELMQIANRLSATNAELQKRLNDAMLGNFFTRLDFLFRVIQNKDSFTDDFIKKCVDEIQESMTLEEEKDKE